MEKLHIAMQVRSRKDGEMGIAGSESSCEQARI